MCYLQKFEGKTAYNVGCTEKIEDQVITMTERSLYRNLRVLML